MKLTFVRLLVDDRVGYVRDPTGTCLS